MADYFGVELPHPFDKEYVDPASARTIARILQEDVTGKCFPPGASLDDLEYDPATAVVIARMLEEDDRDGLTAPQFWDGFDNPKTSLEEHNPGSGTMANNSEWLAGNAAGGDPSKNEPLPGTYTVRGPTPRLRDSFRSSSPPESTLGTRIRADDNTSESESPGKRQRLERYMGEESERGRNDSLATTSAASARPLIPNQTTPHVGFACEETSLAPQKIVPAVRPSISLMLDDHAESSKDNAHITAWIDDVNSCYNRPPATSVSVNRADGIVEASSASLHMQPGDFNAAKSGWGREDKPDDELAPVNVGAQKEQMDSPSLQDTSTTRDGQLDAQKTEATLTDSDDDMLSISSYESMPEEDAADSPAAGDSTSKLPGRVPIGQLSGASESTDTIRIGDRESSSPSASGSPPSVSRIEKGKQRSTKSPGQSGDSSESEWSTLDEECDEFVVVRRRHAKSSDPSSKPLELEKCLLCDATFESLNDLSQASQDEDSVPVGTRIHCPERHAYCAECIARYFASTMANGTRGISDISCPNCAADVWRFDEQEAGRVLAPLALK